jgi:indolepyruvate ferredoxin oxidoreductase beta subunit
MLTSILMVGVGGQGTVLSSDIVCDVALRSDFDVKKSEIHGMAQRGGSVVSQVIFGNKVYSPVIPLGGADILLSFEKMEFLRYLEYKNDSTILLVNTHRIFPPGVAMGQDKYPEDEFEKRVKEFSKKYIIDALKIAKECGNLKVEGMVMLGKLATLLPFEDKVWEEVIKERVPKKTIENNLKAFYALR